MPAPQGCLHARLLAGMRAAAQLSHPQVISLRARHNVHQEHGTLRTIACSLSGPAAACVCAHAAGWADAGLSDWAHCEAAQHLRPPGWADACVPAPRSFSALSCFSELMPCSLAILQRMYLPACIDNACCRGLLRLICWGGVVGARRLYGAGGRPHCGAGVSLWRPRARARALAQGWLQREVAVPGRRTLRAGPSGWSACAQARRAHVATKAEIVSLTKMPGSAL